jgi:hypothetical protein
MTLDASGNLGVGTTSPLAKLDVVGSIRAQTSATSATTLRIGNAGQAVFFGVDSSTGGSNITGSSAYSSTWASNGPIFISTNNGASAQAVIDSSGSLLVSRTSQLISSANIQIDAFGNGGVVIRDATGTGWFQRFYDQGNNQVGSITRSGSTTVYSTSSDYRLKDNIVPMTGALATVSQLKPCTYTWKVDGSTSQGFIAHELAEVCPEAVVGEKDAVDAEGKPQHQGIDTSFLVATLTAAIQELNAKFEAYKSTHP